jgi:hypothetical protein
MIEVLNPRQHQILYPLGRFQSALGPQPLTQNFEGPAIPHVLCQHYLAYGLGDDCGCRSLEDTVHLDLIIEHTGAGSLCARGGAAGD